MTSLTLFKLCVQCGEVFTIHAMTKQKNSCPKCNVVELNFEVKGKTNEVKSI